MQAGMLADATDEGVAFARFNERESCDTSLLLAESTAFLTKIKVLFVDGKALDMGSEGLKQTPTCLQLWLSVDAIMKKKGHKTL